MDRAYIYVCWSLRAVRNLIDQSANLVNRNVDPIPVLQDDPWVPEVADPGRRPCENDSARLQSCSAREARNLLLYGEDHLRRVAVLHHAAVVDCFDGEAAWVRDGSRRHQNRA